MCKRIVIGGVVAGIAMFLWQGLAHEVLPIGRMGLSLLPNDEPIAQAVRDTVKEDGLYFIPGMPGGFEAAKDKAVREAWMEKEKAGPSGLLLLHPHGGNMESPKLLATQCGIDIVACLIAAWLLSRALGGLRCFGSRWSFVALLGVLPPLVVNLPYWNWYGFPCLFTVAAFIEHVVGFAVAGAILAAIVKPPAAAAATA